MGKSHFPGSVQHYGKMQHSTTVTHFFAHPQDFHANQQNIAEAYRCRVITYFTSIIYANTDKLNVFQCIFSVPASAPGFLRSRVCTKSPRSSPPALCSAIATTFAPCRRGREGRQHEPLGRPFKRRGDQAGAVKIEDGNSGECRHHQEYAGLQPLIHHQQPRPAPRADRRAPAAGLEARS